MPSREGLGQLPPWTAQAVMAGFVDSTFVGDCKYASAATIANASTAARVNTPILMQTCV